MKSRLAVIVVAVVVPLVALGVVISQRDSSHSPARLPIALGGTAGTADAALARPSLYPYGGIVYKAGPDLPALDGSARAYKVTPDPDVANGLRAVFSEGSLQIDSTSLFWSYSTGSGSGVASSGVAVACAPDAVDCPVPPTTIPQRPADLPSHDDAKALALDLLQRAGIDTSSVAVTVDDYTTQWSVRVDPIVDGTTTQGFGTNVTIGDHGVIEYANGVAGRVEPADEYPLIGTKTAIDLLNQGRGFIGPVPLAAAGGPVGAVATDGVASSNVSSAAPGSGATEPSPPVCDGSGAPTTFACTPDTPTTGTIPPPPPQEVVLTAAERVLMFAPSYTGGDAFLVPGYHFHTSEGDGPTVLAIADSFIAPPVDLSSSTKGSEPTVTIEPSPPQPVEPSPAPLPPANGTVTTGG